MKKLKDQILGDLSYEYGWTRPYGCIFLGKKVSVNLAISCDEGDEIESSQREAFQRFDEKADSFLAQAEVAIFEYYQSNCQEYRDRFGIEFADEMAPIIHSQSQLGTIVLPIEIIIKQSFGANERIVGLLYDCSWEPSLGLAVKFVDECLEEVGVQDIVL
ncbi:hypothetical protein [Undibacterium sp.]|uniref:DUF6985 domain-containing protein n=1 Tax=Undibacterium sp. TaxID=1914977 RepID=UPI00272FADC2|nr:hypothetical protein [Undibacterium sp.]MDP1978673.1 hypothetical protein [Undibacterium sp.]